MIDVKAANSSTLMATTLVVAVFDMKTLRESNLRGVKSKINPNAPRKTALNPQIMAEIYSNLIFLIVLNL